MANTNLSPKRIQIDKANAAIFIAVAVAAVLATFTLVSGQALLKKRSFQAKVISEKSKASKQLKKNIEATSSLEGAYKEFVSAQENILGGTSTGQGERDGDNAKIVLDALPSKYDFPALATSLEKILSDRNYRIVSISGTDEEVTQNQSSTGATAPVEIPFQMIVATDYNSIQNLLQTLERSIRPIQVDTLSITGSNSNIQLTINGKTYYQPEKSLTITTKDIKP